VILGYRSGIRNENNNMRLGINPLEDIIGAEIEAYEALDQNSKVHINYKDEKFKLDVWRDILKATTGETIISYEDYGYDDKACVMKNGPVYYFGASLPQELMNTLYKDIFEQSEIEINIINESVEMIKLKYHGEEKKFFLNHDFTVQEGIEPISYIRR
jgi:beta-galactosidase GanA